MKTLVGSSVFECVTSYSRRGFVGDELDRLNNTIDDLVGCAFKHSVVFSAALGGMRPYLVFDTRVFSLGVFTDNDRVDVVVRSLESFD